MRADAIIAIVIPPNVPPNSQLIDTRQARSNARSAYRSCSNFHLRMMKLNIVATPIIRNSILNPLNLIPNATH